MKRTFILVLTVFILNGVHFLCAQNNTTKKKNAGAKKEQEVIDIFSDADISFSHTPAAKQESEQKNLLKLDLIQILNGNLILNYERVLSSRLGIELGGGLSYSRYEILPFLSEIEDADVSYGNPKFGPYLSALLKYYTDNNDAPEGYFVGLGTRYSSFSFEPRVDYFYNGFTSLESCKRLDLLRILFGHTYIWDRFVSEVYIGTGIKKVTEVAYIYSRANVYQKSPAVSKNGLFFTFGYKFGMYF